MSIPDHGEYSMAGGEEHTDSVAFMVADKTVKARLNDPKYGQPNETAHRVALAFSAVLGAEVKPHQAVMMLLVHDAIRYSKAPDDVKALFDAAGHVRMAEFMRGPNGGR